MADILHERVIERPVATSESTHGSGINFLLGVILLLIVLYLLFTYGLPMIRTAATPSVSVPEKINVNVTTPNE